MAGSVVVNFTSLLVVAYFLSTSGNGSWGIFNDFSFLVLLFFTRLREFLDGDKLVYGRNNTINCMQNK